jgi:hypothetical protein
MFLLSVLLHALPEAFNTGLTAVKFFSELGLLQVEKLLTQSVIDILEVISQCYCKSIAVEMELKLLAIRFRFQLSGKKAYCVVHTASAY